MSTVEVDGQAWQDGWVGVDAGGTPWRLSFVPSTWAAIYDRWVWHGFGSVEPLALDSAEVQHPLTRVWPVPEAPKPARRS